MVQVIHHTALSVYMLTGFLYGHKAVNLVWIGAHSSPSGVWCHTEEWGGGEGGASGGKRERGGGGGGESIATRL
jgi:hypothetical protein